MKQMEDEDKEWEDFETDQDPPRKQWDSRLHFFCKYFFSFLGLLLVFTLGGMALLRVAYRLYHNGAAYENYGALFLRFSLCGTLSLGIFLWWWRKHQK